MIRAIIGGAIGAAVATTVWLGLENNLNRSFSWMVLIVGLCAGLGVRLACKADKRTFMTGAVSVLMALIGMVGGNFANLALLRSKVSTGPIVSARTTFDEDATDEDATDEDATDEDATDGDWTEPSAAEQAAAEDDGSPDDPGRVDPGRVDPGQMDSDADDADEDQAALELESSALPTGSALPVVDTQLPRIDVQPGEYSRLDLAYYGLGCVLAYLLGTGGGKPSGDAVPTGQPNNP